MTHETDQADLLYYFAAAGVFDVAVDIYKNEVVMNATYGNTNFEMELTATCKPLRYLDVRCAEDTDPDPDHSTILDAWIHNESDLLDTFKSGKRNALTGGNPSPEVLRRPLKHFEVIGPTCVNVICEEVTFAEVYRIDVMTRSSSD
jgi:hypothetical protein